MFHNKRQHVEGALALGLYFLLACWNIHMHKEKEYKHDSFFTDSNITLRFKVKQCWCAKTKQKSRFILQEFELFES